MSYLQCMKYIFIPMLLLGVLSCQSQQKSLQGTSESVGLRAPDSTSHGTNLKAVFPVENGFYDVVGSSDECVGGPVGWRQYKGEEPLLVVGTRLVFTGFNQPELIEKSPDGRCENKTLTRLEQNRVLHRRTVSCSEPASYLIVIESLTLESPTRLSYEIFHKNTNEEPARSVVKCVFTKK